MAKCNVAECERNNLPDGVIHRLLRVRGLVLEAVPLCEEHYDVLREEVK